MKRPTKIKQNHGPKNPHSRKERAEKKEKFIADIEQHLIRLIDKRSKEPGADWAALSKELEERSDLLRRTYPDRKGEIIIAARNIELALHKVMAEAMKKDIKVAI